MLKNLDKKDVAYAAECCWALYLDPATRCYPAFACREDMVRSFAAFCENESGKLLGYWLEGKLTGVCALYFDENTRDLQVNALYVWDAIDLALDALLSEMESNFAGYEANVGAAPENVCLAAALMRHGYEATETGADLRYDALTHTPKEDTTQGIFLLEDETDDGFEEYAPLHDKWFPGDYWSSARLRELQGDWQALILRGKDGMEGAMIVLPGHDMAEIYALHAKTQAAARSLIAGMLWQNETAEFGVNEILFLVRSRDNDLCSAARACGFTVFGNYVGWRKRL